MTIYRARRQVRSQTLNLRGLSCRVHRWGNESDRPLLLLHGWMDCGATWQFLVDAMQAERHVVAPDWRGFGHSARAPGGYWFPDYLADLDALLDQVAGDTAADLVGHSMGGNVAGLYAGVRPERVARLALLEGFGMTRRPPERAPDQYRRWLEQLRQPPVLGSPGAIETLARRLCSRHPRLPIERARFVAEAWTTAGTDGERRYLADPWHKAANPVLYRLEEAESCWQRVSAPTLCLLGEESGLVDTLGGEEELRRRVDLFTHGELQRISACGHMLHHEQPGMVAEALEDFFRRRQPAGGRD